MPIRIPVISTSGAKSTITLPDPVVTSPPSPGGLPAPWIDADIGAPSIAGSASASAGVFTVKGSAVGPWVGTDQFHFVYQSLSGDGTIIARVASQANTNPWAKAGVMIKQSTTAMSPYALLIVSPGHGVNLQWGYNQSTTGPVTSPPNAWLKMTRTGSTITGYSSVDGQTWTQVGQATVTFTAPALIGLFVCSGDVTLSNTSTFDNVSVTAAIPPPPTVTSISPNPAAAGLVTINGSGFLAGATVSFGGTAATGVTVVSSARLTCTAPAHADGPVPVTVTTAAGTSSAVTFVYQASAPPPPTGGPSPAYWGKWSNGPSTSNTWFPLGAFSGAVLDTGVVAPYADLGAAFVGANFNFTAGTDTWGRNNPAFLARIKALGLKTFMTPTDPYGPLSGRHQDMATLAAHPEVADCVIGWAMGDEFDLGPQHSVAGDQYGPIKLHEWYLANRPKDTTRPQYLNWGPWLPGSGCAPGNGFWPYPSPETRLETGSVASDSSLWVSSSDVNSYDFYFWSTDWSSMVGAWGYGAYVDGLRRWSRMTDVTRPVWGMVEAASSIRARPDLPPLNGFMLESAIWSTIVHGARGIVYFINTLGDMNSAGPWGTGYWNRTVGNELIATLTKCHARILSLAPVLNSPETGVFDAYGRELCNSFVTVSSTNGVPIDLMYREYGGKKYVFAQASGSETMQQSGSTTGTFRLVPGASGTVTVRDENRTVTATNGIWADTFTPYQMHIYVI